MLLAVGTGNSVSQFGFCFLLESDSSFYLSSLFPAQTNLLALSCLFFCPFLFFPKCSAIPIYYHPRGKGFHNYCRDHGATGSVKGINTGLNAYFFGDDLKGELTVERFLEFQRSLQEEILALEFKKKDEEGTGKIAEKDFADLLIAYAGFQPKKKARMLRRVR